MENRTSSADVSATSRDRSTNRPTVWRTSPPQTASMAGTVAPPANTAIHRKTRRSSSKSRS